MNHFTAFLMRIAVTTGVGTDGEPPWWCCPIYAENINNSNPHRITYLVQDHQHGKRSLDFHH
ncbi:hypothetical protein SAMN04489740_4002 [Arthrobacter alpinus]|uniref:Uncharacterized protein n=1 Tax=Arthrobacter alpinus TaxID=656366 RepID=A0A1H5PAB7_9MICC|nr:hypothetical protein SAMN04489740_4002 [Arthrobacter alpinus]